MKKFISVLTVIILGTAAAHGYPVGSFVGEPKTVMDRMALVRLTDFSKVVAKGRLATILTEPIIRLLWTTQVVSKADWIGIQGLASIHRHIDPGGAEGDGTNLFIYSCRGGWLDMGHVINTALAYKAFRQTLRSFSVLRTILPGMISKKEAGYFSEVANQLAFKQTAVLADFDGLGPVKGGLDFWAGYFAMRAGYHLENRQFGKKEEQKFGKFDSWATSAYTLEDIPSDYYGILLASYMERKHTFKGVVKEFTREVKRLMEDVESINFKNRVKLNGKIVNAIEVMKLDADYYKKMTEITRVRNTRGASQDPMNPYNFTITPKKTVHHSVLCDANDNPINLKGR